MSFAVLYRLWSGELLEEYTRLYLALASTGTRLIGHVTPAFPVALIITDVYAYARRHAETSEDEFF